MTAINSWLDPSGVVVMSDTLMTLPDGRPAALVAKVYPIPQINALISGRGSSDLIAGWAFDVMCRWVVVDFDGLVTHAPEELAQRWDAMTEHPASTTVFMWGWSPAAGRFLGYAFRSGAGFEPEPLEDGRRCAPGVEDVERYEALMAQEDQLGGLLGVMLLAAEEERAKPDLVDRCHIGGEVVQHVLRLEGDGRITTTSEIIHTFDDRDADLGDAMLLRLTL